MKKIFLIVTSVILCAVSIFASTTTITPAVGAPMAVIPNFAIDYFPSAAIDHNYGQVYVNIPASFGNPPSNTSSDNGFIQANIMSAGTLQQNIPQASIQIAGHAVTITGISLTTGQYLEIIYGSGSGINTPQTPGDYIFDMQESTDSGATFVAIADPPKLHVTIFSIQKTSSAVSMMAGNTFTYHITYNNIAIDGAHNGVGVTVWDTIPAGTAFVSASTAPVSYANTSGVISWSIPSMTNSTNNTLDVVVSGQSGVINQFMSITNTANIAGADTYNNSYYEQSSVTITVKGVKYITNLIANPNYVAVNGAITLRMIVTNSGNFTATSVYPTTPSYFGTGYVGSASGPVPSSAASLAAGQSFTFTWNYNATSAGTIGFSSSVHGVENTGMVASALTGSNQVTIFIPTPTFTSTYTSTQAPPTFTFTDTATQLPSDTFTRTPTGTAVIVFTATPTDTASQPYPTATDTLTCIGANDTATPTPARLTPSSTPTFTPAVPVYTDRNYIEPSKGEKLSISCQLPSDGTVLIQIINLNGEIVKTIVRDFEEKGMHHFEWDAKNDAGRVVARGIYFIHIKQGNYNTMKKVVVLK
jgi:uncharacterized repeat protein (TIGR01451 family)